jgi:creatinine amidohydrolase/Fe(II)-dependent formamide hydrolase-like protein
MHLLWGECTWEDIAQAAREDYIVILPAGAIEQHGPMLPVDVDARLAERNAIEGAQYARDRYHLNLLVLPPLHYGQSCHHMKFPGTISLRFETYIAALYDIMRTVIDWGFRSIVIANGNGGNANSLEVARYKLMEEIAREGKDARIYLHTGHSDPYIRERHRELSESGVLPDEHFGIHAAAYETSMMLADRPHVVKRDKMLKPTLTRDTEPDFAWRTDEVSPTGAFGDPSLATEDCGTALWDAWAEGIARFCVKVSEETGSGKKR